MVKPRLIINNQDDFRECLQDNPDIQDNNWRIKLDSNENAYGCSLNIIDALKNVDVQELSSFYCGDRIKQKLALLYNIQSSNLLLTNDSSDALKLLIETYLENNDELLSTVIDYQDVQANIASNTKIVYIATPNCETGEFITPSVVEKLAAQYPNILFIVDCSYLVFCEFAGFNDFINLTRQYSNVALIKSFSFEYGLSAVQSGVVVADLEIINNIKKISPNNFLNYLSFLCLRVSLNDSKYLPAIKEKIIQTREFLTQELTKLNYKVYPSQANFILCNFGNHCDFYYNKLINHKIIVKKYNKNSSYYNHLRITIPKHSAAKYFLEVIRMRELLIFEFEGILFNFKENSKGDLIISIETIKELSKKYNLLIYAKQNIEIIKSYLRKFNLEKYFSLTLPCNTPYIKKPKFFLSSIEGAVNANKNEIETIGIIPSLDSSYNSSLKNNYKHLGVSRIIENIEEFKSYLKTLI